MVLKYVPRLQGENSNYTVEKLDDALAECYNLISPMEADGQHVFPEVTL